MASPYTAKFAELVPGYDPRHIEAFVRIEHSTLGHLTPARLKREAIIARHCVDAAGPAQSEALAASFGL